MDESHEDGNAFAIRDLWKTSSLAKFEQDEAPRELGLEPLTEPFPSHNGVFSIPTDLELHLPDLSSFTYGPLEDFGALSASSVASSPESFEVPELLEEDIWSFPEADEVEHTCTKLNSWEAFYDSDFQEPRPVYISEGGPGSFDAALAANAHKIGDDGPSQGPGQVVQSSILLSCLFQVGLGRESVLYRYDPGLRSFQPCIEDGRMTGYSLEAFQSLSNAFVGYGNQTRELHSFIKETRASSRAFPALLTLAGSFSSLLAMIQAETGESTNSVRSLLQLQSLFEKPGQILTLLIDLYQKLRRTKTDEELLSRLFGIVVDSEHTAAWLQTMLFHVFTSVSKSWLESASGWLGLKGNAVTGLRDQSPDFDNIAEEAQRVQHERGLEKSEYPLGSRSIPTFIADEDAKTIFEICRSLRLLEAHQPEHPLLRPALSLSEIPKLDWCSSWADVEKIQAKAKEYESKVIEAIEDYDLKGRKQSSGLDDTIISKCEHEAVGLSAETAKAYISASIIAFEQPLPQLDIQVGNIPIYTSSQDRFAANGISQAEIFTPPLSLLPALSFHPLLSTQSHLVNRACLRLLFKDCKLRSHFSLLHRYSLFGDGVFTSRLSHALFDPELPSTERRKGRSRAGTSGLKLGSRDIWPPASSELRLALMGILTESYHYNDRSEGLSPFRDELPGGLSFAIREMSEEDLKRCMDPNSIEALDFLRLQYNPPPPLDAVITQKSLLKYDAVFKLLLRIVRMQFVVNQLFRDTRYWAERSDYLLQQFRVESHHFILAISGYLFDGVQACWSTLEKRLEDVERALDRGSTETLSNLRNFHEHILDDMMFSLILRKRQAQVMKLLEEIFSLILRLARRTRREPSDVSKEDESETDAKQMYEKFKKKVRVFISVCRGLSERRGHGGATAHDAYQDTSKSELSEDGGNTIGQLLLKFEMNCFYAR